MASPRRSRAADPARLEVFHQLLAAICEQAGAALQNAAVSPNIRERRDFSVALFDVKARLIAQAAHIPVHLGSARDSVVAVTERMRLAPGDVAILNDPFAGGTHLPDITMVRPIFIGSASVPAWFAVNRAHHADIGGATPGSMAVATELLAEGLVLPPVKIKSAGVPCEDVLALIRANVRGAAERMLDLRAQESSLLLAERRLLALTAEYGPGEVSAYADHLLDWTERLVRAEVRRIPAGTFHAEEAMHDDGAGSGPFPIRLALRAARGTLHFDFRGTAPKARGGINTNPSVVLAACVYVLRCLCPPQMPTNDGIFRCVRVLTERGSLVDPTPPAAVAGGNVETSQRLVDVALAALGQALPGRIPAASAGTMSNLSVGGDSFTFYETLPGGAGAGPFGAGTSAVQTHMTNTRNTPVEELENCYPVRVRRLTVRRGSGGAGHCRGGDGIVKEIELLRPATVSLFAERHDRGPAGSRGGGAGATGSAGLTLRSGARRRLPAKGSWVLGPGDRVQIETPGGGGYGGRRRQ